MIADLKPYPTMRDSGVPWLGEVPVNAEEKLVLVFVHEVGGVDNATYRDLTGVETLRASAGLRHLCELELLEKKGQSTATYYVPGERFRAQADLASAAGAPLAADPESPMLAGKPSMAAGRPSGAPR